MKSGRVFLFGTVLCALAFPGNLWSGGNAQNGNSAYYVSADGNDRNDGLSRETPFLTLGKALDTVKRSRIKRIAVIGVLTEASEQQTGYDRDPESVFFIKDTGRAEITIRGMGKAGLDAGGTHKRAVKITGRSNIRFEHIVITKGFLNADTAGNGGGIYLLDNGTVALGPGAAVSGNGAIQGGGIFALGSESAPVRVTLAGGKVINNRAEGSVGEAGAGIYMQNGICKMLSGDISDNVAVDDNGGGLLLKAGTLEMTGGTVSGNVGGGLYLVRSTFAMKDGIIQNNRVTFNAGGVALFMSEFTMTGGEIRGNTAAQAGGGVFVLQSVCTLSGGEIAHNAADYGGGVCINATDGNNTVDFAMTGGSIHHNQAKESGGGVFIINGTVELSGQAELNNNTALSGGGLGVENSVLQVKGDARIRDNRLSGNGYGGGIYVTTGTLNLSGGRISGNSGLYGGGVSVMDCAFTMSGAAAITGNTADNSGGGIFFGNSTFEMTSGEIAQNVARNSGGGIYAGGYCTILLAGGTITGNQSAKEGGGIDVRAYNIVTLTGGTLKGNRAEKGGAVHVWEQGVFNMWNNSVFKPEGGVIAGNEADTGGGIYVDRGGDLTRNGGSLEGNAPEDIIAEN
ncbi:MAG: hypothetical protein LBG87_05880 [Spirochaetaceae bacterium]|jgi:predicted outer membrane repeat protein|nr:hypothetical protein [Spirochaetaceae bacterium]